MKYSVKRQFAIIFIILMVGVIFLCSLVNTLFLGKYYQRRKTQTLYRADEFIGRAAAGDGYDSEEFQQQLDNICSSSNIMAFVMDADSKTRYVSENGGERLEMTLFGYIMGYSMEPIIALERGENYIIQKVGDGESGFLEIYGRLNTGISFIMRTPLESIKESARLANKFFFYVGILGAAAGGVIIWLVTGKITKPILQLNDISEKMVHLDFDAKYEGENATEFGLLGQNMNKLSESLEKAISELKTAHNELRRDIERKDKIDEMRREFLSNVSHELKTPIALIRGYAEGLQEGMGEDPESRDFYCDVIVDEATKMNQMVRKLLTLNQLEFGNDIVELERFDLTALISNALQTGLLLARQQGITVEMKEYPAYHVWADAFMVEEVLQNYFSNALHYCTGEKRVEISLEETEDKIRVKVFNTGKQIPEESLPFLWDKFYKVDKARTREYGGSGVGLSIVKAIMESMHQKYGVRNMENGVEFWFELERADAGKENQCG